MSVSKSDEFENRLQRVSRVAKLLAHPARLAILEFLGTRTACMSGELSRHLPLSRATVAKHLQDLKDAGWIQGEIVGASICYCIHEKNFAKDKKVLQNFLSMKVSPCGESCS